MSDIKDCSTAYENSKKKYLDECEEDQSLTSKCSPIEIKIKITKKQGTLRIPVLTKGGLIAGNYIGRRNVDN